MPRFTDVSRFLSEVVTDAISDLKLDEYVDFAALTNFTNSHKEILGDDVGRIGGVSLPTVNGTVTQSALSDFVNETAIAIANSDGFHEFQSSFDIHFENETTLAVRAINDTDQADKFQEFVKRFAPSIGSTFSQG